MFFRIRRVRRVGNACETVDGPDRRRIVGPLPWSSSSDLDLRRVSQAPQRSEIPSGQRPLGDPARTESALAYTGPHVSEQRSRRQRAFPRAGNGKPQGRPALRPFVHPYRTGLPSAWSPHGDTGSEGLRGQELRPCYGIVPVIWASACRPVKRPGRPPPIQALGK